MTTKSTASTRTAKNPFANETVAVAETAGSFVGDLIRLAATEIEHGDYAQAENYLNQGLARDPSDHRCRAYLAVCQAMRDPHSREVERAVRGIIDAHPDDPVGYLAMGQVYLQRSRRREAFRLFAQARKLASQERALRRQLERVEPRRAPVFPSLSRNHFLNIYGGRIRGFFSRLGSR